jgi:hypothetical protein
MTSEGRGAAGSRLGACGELYGAGVIPKRPRCVVGNAIHKPYKRLNHWDALL